MATIFLDDDMNQLLKSECADPCLEHSFFPPCSPVLPQLETIIRIGIGVI